jgi:hypothetical protein
MKKLIKIGRVSLFETEFREDVKNGGRQEKLVSNDVKKSLYKKIGSC